MAGITVTGFEKKTNSEIRNELNQKYKDIFGFDIDLNDTSVFAQLIGIQAEGIGALWDLAEAVYNSFDIDSAEGISLDRLCALNNIYREEAVKSSAICLFTGKTGTIITTNNVVRQSIALQEFTTDNILILDLTDLYSCKIRIKDEEQEPHYFDISYDGNTYSYITYLTDTTSIINYFANEINNEAVLSTKIEALNDNNDLLIRFKTYSISDTFIISNISIGIEGIESSKNGTVTAVAFGEVPVPERTIDEIVTQVSNWTGIINYITGTVGRDAETDEQLRERYIGFISGGGNATEDAIAAKLSELTLVINASVISNRNDEIDAQGRPPHSFEAICNIGKDLSLITLEERNIIAQRIWDTMPAGIDTYSRNTIIDDDPLNIGNLTPLYGTAQDIEGDFHKVYFSVPENVYIYCYIEYTKNDDRDSDEIFPVDGEAQIKNSVANFANNISNVGTDIFATKLYEAVYDVPGVGNIIKFIIKKDSFPLPIDTTTYIQINDNESAIFDTTKIQVQEIII